MKRPISNAVMKREIDLQELVTWLCAEAEMDVAEFYSGGGREYVVRVPDVFDKLRKLAKMNRAEMNKLIEAGEKARKKTTKSVNVSKKGKLFADFSKTLEKNGL